MKTPEDNEQVALPDDSMEVVTEVAIDEKLLMPEESIIDSETIDVVADVVDLDGEVPPPAKVPPLKPTLPGGTKVVVADNLIVTQTPANKAALSNYADVEAVSLLGTSFDMFARANKQWDNVTQTEESLKWLEAMGNGATVSSVVHGKLDGASFRPDANWGNNIGYGGTIFGPRKLKVATPSGSGTLKGKEAIAQMSAMTGVGGANSYPMWASGFNLTLSTPTLAAQVELDRRIASDRMYLGRITRGAIFSNDSFAINRNLVRFIFDHIVAVGLDNGTSYEKFINSLRLPDLQCLAMDMANCIHSSGFPFAQPCLADPSVCTHVAHRHINVAKLAVVDHNKLNNNQLKLITRPGKISEAELKQYQDEFAYTLAHVELNANTKIFFKVPTVADHLHSGARWATEIEHRTETAFGTVLDEEERLDHYSRMRIATVLRNYGHWISRVELLIGEDVIVVEDSDVIEEQLNIWSKDDNYIDTIITGIESFMNESLVAYAGVPNFECPNCQSWLVTDNGEARVYHPIDAVSTFFQMQQSYLVMKV